MTNSLILRGSRKERKSKNLKQRSGEWLIVCGGEKTEVNYIKSLINYVNRYNGNYKINRSVLDYAG